MSKKRRPTPKHPSPTKYATDDPTEHRSFQEVRDAEQHYFAMRAALPRNERFKRYLAASAIKLSQLESDRRLREL